MLPALRGPKGLAARCLEEGSTPLNDAPDVSIDEPFYVVVQEAPIAAANAPDAVTARLGRPDHGPDGGVHPRRVLPLVSKARVGSPAAAEIDPGTGEELRDMVTEGKELGRSTALSGHLRIQDLDELARINPDIVGVRGAVCSSGERNRTVAWEAVAEFKRELDLRKSGEVSVRAEPAPITGNGSSGGADGGWVIIDGRGKSCAGVIAALNYQLEAHRHSFVEAILADALNIYDVILWTENAGHRLVTQRKDADGTVRVLIQPNAG